MMVSSLLGSPGKVMIYSSVSAYRCYSILYSQFGFYKDNSQIIADIRSQNVSALVVQFTWCRWLSIAQDT